MKKKIGYIGIGILTFIVVLFAVWALISTGRIRTYQEPDSISEKFVTEINGARQGFFINSKNPGNPVLLLVSSGPGTDDYVFTDKYEDMDLEEDFTVVYWDYRYMGIAYDSDADTDSITLKNLLEDTHAVTGFLKERFGKEKIYIMGFSGGSHIALRAAEEHPEDYYAYIGMAQAVTDSTERDVLIYDFMKDVFTKRGEDGKLEKLEQSVDHLDDGSVRCTNWYDYVDLLHDAGGGTIRDKSEFAGIVWPIITCSCYTIGEKIDYIRAMKMYRKTPLAEDLHGFDYRESITELEIPAFFLSGEYDYNCPWELVSEYCDVLEAPDKAFYKISDSAHSPLWENAAETCGILRQIRDKTNK